MKRFHPDEIKAKKDFIGQVGQAGSTGFFISVPG